MYLPAIEIIIRFDPEQESSGEEKQRENLNKLFFISFNNQC